jgi:GGDEF domain-containing protein
MAAGDSTSSIENAPAGGFDWPGPAELDERLLEEIGRAERHGTSLSCLLVVVDNLDEVAGEGHRSEGVVAELRQQTIVYIAGALRREMRRFDRVGLPSERELLIVLPGADGPRGEMVARRVLDRLRAIKVEARGRREPLRISVGLVAWRANATPAVMLERARAAAERPVNGNGGGAPGPGDGGDEAVLPEPTSPPS